MKKIVMGNELREKMKEAIHLLCDTVKMTLGPSGNNVIIDHSSFSPFITNDGVTIASNIESDDEVINTILEIAKEASVKTNEVVGDGTTTTLVLLQSIFENGMKYVNEGVNPILIKKELDILIKDIIEEVKLSSRIPSNEELFYLASISANDEDIGKKVSEVYKKIGDRKAIFIKENNDSDTKINYLNGYILDTFLASEYFMRDLKEINYTKAFVLLVNNYLDDVNIIANILNEIIFKKQKLIIFANDYSDLFVNDILSYNLDNDCNIILLKNPLYGRKQITILKDISAISRARIVEKIDYIDCSYLGVIQNIKINRNKTILSFLKDKNIENRIEELCVIDDEDINFVDMQKAMFNNGMAEILVGDKTITARREKKMRYDDALCAISTASKGVVPGSGVVLLKISNKINEDNYAKKILKEALQSVFIQIMNNAGIDYKEILNNICENDYQVLFNLNTLKYENILETKVIDSTSVLINSLISSVSIAGMLLTTTSIVINEYKNNLNKINDYNEL